MADDGSGSDITISTFLMFVQYADPIIAKLKTNQMVLIEMAWSLPYPDDRVEYELWTSPPEMFSRDFQIQFKDAAVALGEHAYFTPHMYIYDGIKSGCRSMDGKPVLQSMYQQWKILCDRPLQRFGQGDLGS